MTGHAHPALFLARVKTCASMRDVDENGLGVDTADELDYAFDRDWLPSMGEKRKHPRGYCFVMIDNARGSAA